MAFLGRETEQDAERVARRTAWILRQHPHALLSLGLSALSLTHFGTLWVDEIAGVALGVYALVQLRRARRDPKAAETDRITKTEGDWLAWGGIAVGTGSFVLAFIIYFVLPMRR